MKAHLIDTHLQVPRSRSSAKVKVKYQGHVSQKMGVSGALLFHKYIFFFTVNTRSDFTESAAIPARYTCIFRYCVHVLFISLARWHSTKLILIYPVTLLHYGSFPFTSVVGSDRHHVVFSSHDHNLFVFKIGVRF